MKLGLVGLGYWGKILLKNLETITDDIIIYDKYLENGLYNGHTTVTDVFELLQCDNIFIVAPFTQHYEICKYFLANKKNVFCEKPLTENKYTVTELYELAKQNNCKLFVDWIFTFNSSVLFLKELYESGRLGKIRSITMNRINSGPERMDTNAKWDLASHDVSIIQFIFNKIPKIVKWYNFKRNKRSYQEDSTFGIIEYEDFDVLINASWCYSQKDRRCVFEFDKDIIVWDDNSQKLKGQHQDYSKEILNLESPLIKSIKTFLSSNFEQEDLTNSITQILEA